MHTRHALSLFHGDRGCRLDHHVAVGLDHVHPIAANTRPRVAEAARGPQVYWLRLTARPLGLTGVDRFEVSPISLSSCSDV